MSDSEDKQNNNHEENTDIGFDVKGRDISIDSMLVDGEEILRDAKVHWGIFVPPIFYTLIGLLLFVLWNKPAGIMVWLMTSVPLFNAIVLYYTIRLVLTNKRVFTKAGFFSRDFIKIKHSRIESSYLERPFLGQVFGYSTVIISGTGTGTIPVRYVDNGSTFLRILEEFTLADKPAKTKNKEQSKT